MNDTGLLRGIAARNDGFYIEESLKNGVVELLTVKVNELLLETAEAVPAVEMKRIEGAYKTLAQVAVVGAETSEKERVLEIEAFTVGVTLDLPCCNNGEHFCYAYAWAIGEALTGDRTLSEVADYAEVTAKKYMPPVAPQCGDAWRCVFTLRVITEKNLTRRHGGTDI
jgi:hypothetical protein